MLQRAQKPSDQGRNRMCTAHVLDQTLQFSCILGLGLQTSESGRECKCDSLCVGRAAPKDTGSAWSCLTVVLCQGWQGLASSSPSFCRGCCRASASANGWERFWKQKHNTGEGQEPARGIGLCKNRLLLISLAGPVLVFMQLFLR